MFLAFGIIACFSMAEGRLAHTVAPRQWHWLVWDRHQVQTRRCVGELLTLETAASSVPTGQRRQARLGEVGEVGRGKGTVFTLASLRPGHQALTKAAKMEFIPAHIITGAYM